MGKALVLNFIIKFLIICYPINSRKAIPEASFSILFLRLEEVCWYSTGFFKIQRIWVVLVRCRFYDSKRTICGASFFDNFLELI